MIDIKKLFTAEVLEIARKHLSAQNRTWKEIEVMACLHSFACEVLEVDIMSEESARVGPAIMAYVERYRSVMDIAEAKLTSTGKNQ